MRIGNQEKVNCRRARRRFADLATRTDGASGAEVVRRHVESCARCAGDYRLYALGRTVLDAAGASEPVRPGDDFYVSLRARLARGPAVASDRRVAAADDSWAAALVLTGRQLIPAMALLLLVIIGATLAWSDTGTGKLQLAARPSERVLFNDIYDIEPTTDDVLETLVAVEEKENAK